MADLFVINVNLRKAIESVLNLGKAMDKTAKKAGEIGNRIAGGTDKATTSLRTLELRLKNLQRSLAKATDPKTIIHFNKRIRQTQIEMQKLKTAGVGAFQSINRQASLSRQIFLRLRSVMITVFGAYGLIRLIRGTIDTVRDFELGMARVEAITNATAKEIEFLSTKARLLGATKLFSPTEITELQVKLAKLGFTIKEIGNAIEPIINLATATGEDLASAAELAASVIRGMQLDASETARVVDVMGKAFTSSALDLRRFRESVKFVVPIVNKLGWSIEDLSALLGQLADRQIFGSLAGTALRNILLRVTDANSDLNKAMGGNIKTFDDFLDGLKKLKDSGTDLTDVLELVDRRASSAFVVLLDTVDTLVEYREEMDKATGSIEVMADKIENTMDGAVKHFSASWKTMIVTIQEDGGIITDVLNALASAFRNIAFSIDEGLITGFRLEKFKKEWKKLENSIANGSITIEEAIAQINKEMSKIGDKIRENKALFEDTDLAFSLDETDVLDKRFGLEADIFEKELNHLSWLIDDLNKKKIKGTLFEDFQNEARMAANSGEESLKKLQGVYDGYIDGLKESLAETNKDIENSKEEFLRSQNITSDELTRLFNIIQQGVGDSVESFNEFTRAAPIVTQFLERDDKLRLRATAYNELILQMTEYFKQLQIEMLKTDLVSDEDFLKNQKKILALEKQLALERAKNLKDGRDREIEIVQVNSEFKIKMMELELKYAELSTEERVLLEKLLAQEVENERKKIFDLNTKWNKKDLDQLKKDLKEKEELFRSEFDLAQQLAENEGASKEHLRMAEIGYRIEEQQRLLDAMIAWGATEEEIEKVINKIKELRAEMAGVKVGGEDDDGEDKTEENLQKQIRLYKKFADELIDVFQSIADAQVENSQRRIDDINQRIDETQRELDRETELMIAGFANNVSAKKKEVADLKAVRDRELRQREEALEKQRRIESIQQALNLITAATNIFNQYSKIKFVGIPLAIGVISLMMGAASAQKKEAKSFSEFGEGGEVGMIDAPSHEKGGKLISVEGGEFITKKKQVGKYRELLEMINNNSLPQVDINRMTEIRNDSVINPNVSVSSKQWDNIENLLKQNLQGKSVEYFEGGRIERSGMRTRKIMLN